jgi:hypothetical protein
VAKAGRYFGFCGVVEGIANSFVDRWCNLTALVAQMGDLSHLLGHIVWDGGMLEVYILVRIVDCFQGDIK